MGTKRRVCDLLVSLAKIEGSTEAGAEILILAVACKDPARSWQAPIGDPKSGGQASIRSSRRVW